MKPNVFLIHGIRTKDKGAASMKKLGSYLKDAFCRVQLVSYGYVLIPINNKRAVKALIKQLKQNTNPNRKNVVIGYSNGAWAAVQVAEMGYRIDHLVLISPALHKSHAIPEHVSRVDVYYSSGDRVVEAGKAWSTFANILPWNWKIFGAPHEWGTMGRYGYTGNDPRIHNHKMGEDVGHFWYKDNLLVKSIASQINHRYEEDK